MDKAIRVSQWEHCPWLRAGFSLRTGGRSSVYGDDELNLGWTREDDPARVAESRNLFAAAVAGVAAGQLVTMRQVHGTTIHTVRNGDALATADGRALLEGDGLITCDPGLLLAAQAADCVPVLLVDTRTRAVGAFHAGWRGTVARIVQAGVAAMQRDFGSRPQDMLAAIGPAIRQCCFEVGEEVAEAFAQEFPYGRELAKRVEGGKPHLDLHQANRRQLVDAGLRPDAVTVIAECSACARLPDGRRKFFSYRAEAGKTGRMMGAIGIVHS